MKKLFIAILLSTFILTACSSEKPTSSSSDISSSDISSSESSSSEVSSSSDTSSDTSVKPDAKLKVADAAMYRGVVSELTTTEDGQLTMKLTQAEGRNFGYPSVNIAFDEHTRYGGDNNTINDGSYVEIFYGKIDKTSSAFTPAIAVNVLPDADMSVYNGKFVSISVVDGATPLDHDGFITMKSLVDNSEYMFKYGKDTQFYLNVSELKAGDKLNIYKSPVSTRSLPPQSVAFEVSKYYDGK